MGFTPNDNKPYPTKTAGGMNEVNLLSKCLTVSGTSKICSAESVLILSFTCAFSLFWPANIKHINKVTAYLKVVSFVYGKFYVKSLAR